MKPVSAAALPPTPRPMPPIPVEGPGKSAMAPGQMAKAAVAEARAAGAQLPANAQGLAASQIARGADPASLFAALIPQSETPLDGGEGATGNPAAPTGDAPDASPTDTLPAGDTPIDAGPAGGVITDTATPDADTTPDVSIAAPEEAILDLIADAGDAPETPV